MARKKNRELCLLNVVGLTVHVYLTDDRAILEAEDGQISFGKYDVNKATIWIDDSLEPCVGQSMLFHELYEFVLGYFGVQYDPEDEHDSLMRFGYLLWGVLKENREALFGDPEKIWNEK